MELLLSHGRRGYLNFFTSMQVKIFGTLMRLAVSGELFLTMGLARKDLNVKGEKAMQRVTVALIANASGGKEAAIFVWKSEKPQCFKGIDTTSVPVQYYSQPKAWMTRDILEFVLSKLNRRLSAKGRKIALLMGNAGCHPKDLKDCFSNYRIIISSSEHNIHVATSIFGHYSKLQGSLLYPVLAFCPF